MHTLRLFPHDTALFPTEEQLSTWLMTSLRARGGTYYLISTEATAVPSEENLEAGSIVLFRHRHNILGEAVVWEFDKSPGTTPDGSAYQGVITFVTSSIRLYSPPISIEQLQSLVGESPIVTHPRGYPGIDWNVYPKLLALVTRTGSLV